CGARGLRVLKLTSRPGCRLLPADRDVPEPAAAAPPSRARRSC
ncbi:MAG: hypothetical protein AVDCRST_MAG67-2880, partial [uncultured Solirubrobacteraceae bacterium]